MEDREKGEEVGNGEYGSVGIIQTNKHTRERDYTIEALVLLNQLKLIMNPMGSIDVGFRTEFKSSKKLLPRACNHNLLRAGQ